MFVICGFCLLKYIGDGYILWVGKPENDPS